MKVGIFGGTGALGRGLAVRLAQKNEVFLGSRDRGRGEAGAEAVSTLAGKRVRGGLAGDAASFCDAAIFAVSYSEDTGYFTPLEAPLAGKLVISPIVPMKKEGGRFVYSRPTGSAAELVASALRRSRVAAALHTIPAAKLLDPEAGLDMDVLVACDERETFASASALIGSVRGLRPLYAGPLEQARTLEELTPLILNLARLNGLHKLGVKFV